MITLTLPIWAIIIGGVLLGHSIFKLAQDTIRYCFGIIVQIKKLQLEQSRIDSESYRETLEALLKKIEIDKANGMPNL